jgi:Ca2+-binding EF-hand superfamily protein
VAVSRSSVNPQGDPNQMLKERFSNINTAKAQIERQREFDTIRERLQKEFEALDINRDGLVSLEELQDFLDKKVRDEAV